MVFPLFTHPLWIIKRFCAFLIRVWEKEIEKDYEKNMGKLIT